MNTIELIKSSGWAALNQLSIQVTRHTTLPLNILNYNQIESPRFDPVVRECRGLVLDDKGEYVAKGFDRFYNLGENPQDQCDVPNSSIVEKVDGSFILLYYYDGWRVNTRASFAEGETNGVKWKDLFWRNINMDFINSMWWARRMSFVFELVGPHNQVVIPYPEGLYLLAGICAGNYELNDNELDEYAKEMGVSRPKKYSFGLSDCYSYMTAQDNFEGFVLKDSQNNRLKIKSEKYLSLHRLINNGNIASKRSFVDYYIRGEHYELSATLPQYKDLFDEYTQKLDAIIEMAQIDLERHNHLPQKEFALSIKHLPHRAILFVARRDKKLVKSSLEGFNSLLESYL